MTFRTTINQTTLESRNPGTYALVEASRRSMVQPELPETGDNFVLNTTSHRSADYQSALVNPAATPTDAYTGTPGGFIPLFSNFADLATLKADPNVGDGQGPSAGEMDTKGHYIVLGDASECHYRLGVWSVGRVP